MRIGFPIDTSGRGGAASWVRTFSDYCVSEGHEIFFTQEKEVDIFISLASFLPLQKIIAYKNRGTKIIYRMDGIFFKYIWDEKNKVELFNKQVMDSILHADKVVYQSHFSRLLANQLFGDKEVLGDIIYNGADNKLFKPEGEILSRPRDKKIVLSIAYWGTPLMAENSIKTIIEIAKGLINNKEIEFWILGLAYPQTQKLIQEANLPNISRYDLRTPITRALMPRYIRTADLILHTRSNDACSNLIIEAMNVGIPIVGLHSGSTPELLGDAGLMGACKPSFDDFPVVNIEDMISKILQTFEHYDDFKSKIKERSKLFTQEIMCKKYFKQIEQLINLK